MKKIKKSCYDNLFNNLTYEINKKRLQFLEALIKLYLNNYFLGCCDGMVTLFAGGN